MPAKPSGNAALYLALIAVVFAPLIEGGTTHVPVLIIKLIIVALFMAHALRIGVSGGPAFVRTPVDAAAGLFAVAALLSAWSAPYGNMAATWVQLLVFYVLFYYLARIALRGMDSLALPVAVVVAMGALEAAVSLYQWSAGAERVNGTFFNPNMAAGYISVGIVFAVSALVNSIRGGWRRPGVLAAAAFVPFGLFAVVMSGSRGAALSLAAGFFVVAWFRSRLLAVSAVALLAAVLLVVPNPVRDRALSKEPFAYSRIGIWKGAASMSADHPLGVGLGNYKYFSGRYAFPVDSEVIRYGKRSRTAHNEYLHFTAEMGIPGLAAMLACVFMLLRGLVASARNPAGPAGLPVAVGALGGAVTFLTHSLVDSNMHEPGLVILFLFTACIGFEAGEPTGAKEAGAGRKAYGGRLVVLAGLMAVLLAVWAAKPEAARHYFNRSVDELKSGRPDAALDSAAKALLFDPGDAAYHEHAAAVMFAIYNGSGDRQRLEDCLYELAQAERLNPNNPSYPYRAARVKAAATAGLDDQAKKRALMESALADLGRAGEADPYSAEILYMQAELSARLGEYDRAEAGLVRLREMEPNYLRGRYALAKIYAVTGRELLSAEECYSIIAIHDGLSVRILSPEDERFASVDMDGVRTLLKDAKEA